MKTKLSMTILPASGVIWQQFPQFHVWVKTSLQFLSTNKKSITNSQSLFKNEKTVSPNIKNEQMMYCVRTCRLFLPSAACHFIMSIEMLVSQQGDFYQPQSSNDNEVHQVWTGSGRGYGLADETVWIGGQLGSYG